MPEAAQVGSGCGNSRQLPGSPSLVHQCIGVAVRQLAEQDVLASLDDLARKGNWLPNIPPLLVKNMTTNCGCAKFCLY